MDDSATGYLVALVFAALLGLIPAAIASSKGRSFFGWWVFGTTLFIVAFPAAILVGPDSTALEKRKLEAGEMKKCPYCAEVVKIEALVCKHCGRNLSPSSLVASMGIGEYLQQAETLGRSGQLEQAAQMLEQALSVQPSWGPRIAGYPSWASEHQQEPVTGYALLVHLAGRAGKRTLALKYFGRMLELNQREPWKARQASREAGIVSEAKKVAKQKGVSWRWWE